MALKFMYITNDPQIARIAESNGVERIWIDLEVLGKAERQKMDSVKSHHSIEDVSRLSKVLTQSELMVRVNPWNENSVEEINAVLAAGAQLIMLPMWKTADEVRNFIETVDGRAKTILLLETKEAVACLDEVLALAGFDEIHIGLNDLHLSYGLTFMFELLANGTVETLCRRIGAAGVPYGFGGIARIGKGMLPSEKILPEHVRLGSSMVILSRSFCNVNDMDDLREIERLFTCELAKLRQLEASLRKESEAYFLDNQKELVRIVDEIVVKEKHSV